MVISVTPDDLDKFREYEERTVEVVKRFGGVPLARDSEPVVLESDIRPAFGVVLRFPDKQAVRTFRESDGYQPLKAFRHTFAEASAIVIED